MVAVPIPITPAPGRRLAPITGAQWWGRCLHHGTVVDPATEEVTLSGQPVASAGDWPATPGPHAERAGLAFDGRGWLYHGVPERGQLERVPWPRATATGGNSPVDLLAAPAAPEPAGPAVGFSAVAADPGRPLRARALAADADDHLFVLDGATGTIAVLDLTDGRLLRTVALAWSPVDLAARGHVITVATSARDHPLVEIDAIGEPRAMTADGRAGDPLAKVPPGAEPHRVAVGPDGDVWLLLRDEAGAWVVRMTGERLDQPISVPGADDLDIDGSGRVVVAGPADHDLLVWAVSGPAAEPAAPLTARGYDGRGIATTPEGHIGFWAASGFRLARPPKLRYPGSGGYLDTYQLDSQAYRQQWGRLFLEACIPPGTKVEVGFATSDDLPQPDEMLGGASAAEPPLQFALWSSEDLLNQARPLHRRETGRELTWTPLDRDDRFEVYEAPVRAAPGRYLWLRLHLTGTRTLTPRIRAVRVECEGHNLLQRLPRTYRDDTVAAAFLWRYLAMIDGVLSEMDWRAQQRDLLLDPCGAPAELLPWIASLIGLTLDQRWPEAARREVLAQAICLFRRRGTVPGLKRMLEIYLQSPVAIVETFQLRGRGGAVVGGTQGEPGPASAVVGTSLRVGGEVSSGTGQLTAQRPPDAFATHAHRFSVLIPRDLDPGQLAVVCDLLDLNRPAHTLVDVCAGQGMRVGVGLYLAVSTAVGPSSSFTSSVVGQSSVGVRTVLGHGHAGVRVGATRLSGDTVVDP